MAPQQKARHDVESRHVVVIGGPNGAGKTTIAKRLVPERFGILDFVNADLIAKGLSVLNPDRAALAAGRIMLAHLHELAEIGASFAFETTLASRTFAPWLKSIIAQGYQFDLVVVFVPSADFSVKRVERRVQLGGHFVPETVVRRRYDACFRNFFSLYQPLANSWEVLDNSRLDGPRLIACGVHGTVLNVALENVWNNLVSEYCDEV